jgi:hypothetical protein
VRFVSIVLTDPSFDPSLTDPSLVVGGMASPAWANMNYGTKIEKALELRQNQWSKLAIVQEEHWLLAIQS